MKQDFTQDNQPNTPTSVTSAKLASLKDSFAFCGTVPTSELPPEQSQAVPSEASSPVNTPPVCQITDEVYQAFHAELLAEITLWRAISGMLAEVLDRVRKGLPVNPPFNDALVQTHAASFIEELTHRSHNLALDGLLTALERQTGQPRYEVISNLLLSIEGNL